jgi:hypothetical protein
MGITKEAMIEDQLSVGKKNHKRTGDVSGGDVSTSKG